MNNTDKDFNLLKVFETLLEEKNLTKAAERMGLSQPAMSHALNRLRNELEDPLFVRAARGVTPTPLALKLASGLKFAIDGIDDFYRTAEGDTLSQVSDVVKIATTDYIEQLLLPRIAKSALREIPKVTLLTRNLAGVFPKEKLEKGEFDLAIAGYFKDLPEGYYQRTLFEDHFVCLVSKKNSLIKTKLTLKKFLKCPHVLTTLQGDLDGIVDRELKKIGESRMISFALSSFIAPSFILPETDLILTCLSKIADRMERYLPLKSYPVPIKTPKIKIVQVWHERTHSDPLRKWVRNEIYNCFKAD